MTSFLQKNSSLSVFGNGVLFVENANILSDDVTVHELPLRTGINTIKYLYALFVHPSP